MEKPGCGAERSAARSPQLRSQTQFCGSLSAVRSIRASKTTAHEDCRDSGGQAHRSRGETTAHGMMKCGCGSVGGMVDAALLLDALILALLLAMLARSHSKSEEHHARLDDLVTGVDLFANEVLDRTKILLEMGQRMQPAIELHNHNPLEQIFNFVRGLKTGNFDNENITSHRDSHGQYATAPQNEIEPSTSEVIDISD